MNNEYLNEEGNFGEFLTFVVKLPESFPLSSTSTESVQPTVLSWSSQSFSIQTKGFIAGRLKSSDNLGGFHSLPYPNCPAIPGDVVASGLPHHPTLGLATASIMETWDVHHSGWCHLTCHGDWQQRTSLDLNVSHLGGCKKRVVWACNYFRFYIVTCWYHMCMPVLFNFHQISNEDVKMYVFIVTCM